MKQLKLSNEETLLGFTHKYEISYEDLVAFGATTDGVIVLAPYTAGMILRPAAHRVVTTFDGGATSELTFKVGYNGGTIDDDDALSAAKSVHADATPVLVDAGSLAAVDSSTIDTTYGQQEADVLTSLRSIVNILRKRGEAMVESGNVEITYAATGANLNTLTAGKMIVYLTMIDLAKL